MDAEVIELLRMLIYLDAERNCIYLTEKTVDDCLFDRFDVSGVKPDNKKDGDGKA